MRKLNLSAPINTLGYGVVGLNIFKYALLNNFHISLFPMGKIDTANAHDEDIAMIQQSVAAANRLDNPDAPSLKIWHEFALAERVGSGPSFAFPFFEINHFNQARINHLGSVDHIIVASKWAENIIHNHLPSASTHVVPLGVNASIFSYKSRQTTDKCVFFNCGKWEKRKGHDVILEMFKKAFPTEQDVELWMMCSNPFLSPKQRQEWERYYSSDSRAKVLDRVQNQVDVANIMSATNCGLFPSRAEGWNLELLEMMSMGKHIITTNYSAHTEFCNDSNCDLINITDLEPADDGGVFFDGTLGEWASINSNAMSQGVEYMRLFYERWKSDNSILNKEGIQTAQEFSWNNTIQQLEEAIYGTQSTETQQVCATTIEG